MIGVSAAKIFSVALVQPLAQDGALALPVQLGPSTTYKAGALLGLRSGAQNHVWTIADTPTVSGGTFDIEGLVNPLTGLEQDVTDLAYDISNADLEDALEAVFGAGNVAVAGSGLPGNDTTITLQGNLAGFPAPLPTIDSTNLTGGGALSISLTTEGRSKDTYDLYSSLKQSDPAAAPSPSGTGSGGGFAAGAYMVQVTYETAEGETKGSPVATVALTADQQLRIAAISGLGSNITKVHVYVNGQHVGSITVSGGTVPQTDFTQTSGTAGKRIPTVNTTGRARAIVPATVTTDARGRPSLADQSGGDHLGGHDPSSHAWFRGLFRTTDLTGLDDDAVAQLGRLVKGTTSDGLLAIF